MPPPEVLQQYRKIFWGMVYQGNVDGAKAYLKELRLSKQDTNRVQSQPLYKGDVDTALGMVAGSTGNVPGWLPQPGKLRAISEGGKLSEAALNRIKDMELARQGMGKVVDETDNIRMLGQQIMGAADAGATARQARSITKKMMGDQSPLRWDQLDAPKTYLDEYRDIRDTIKNFEISPKAVKSAFEEALWQAQQELDRLRRLSVDQTLDEDSARHAADKALEVAKYLPVTVGRLRKVLRG